jgi:hypothetical protein
MKANRSNTLAEKDDAFSFIIPMTMAIVVGIALLVIGTFVIGEITTTLEDSFGVATSRSSNENKTVTLLGNITDGFSDIVDIEIVVIIIAALSMAIFTILAVGTRPSF